MWMSEANRRNLVELVSKRFNSFGGGNMKHAEYNPIVSYLADGPPVFAAGVDVGEVVRFIVDQIEEEK